jgi:regulator of sigma E protease
MLATAFDLLTVLVGFGLIVFVHELGHFLAARWAGIRVLAFAIGFGPALVTFRKGLGWRRAGTEHEYLQIMKERGERARARAEGDLASTPVNIAPDISPTEYRLNVLPFGGYVKMLGQDDTNPLATSDAPDSYQRCVPWKRMVVISAGVVMNLFTAALLFIVVMMAGRDVDAPVLGAVVEGSPAARAKASDQRTELLASAGLRPGDRVTRIDDRDIRSFDEVALSVAMARPGSELRVTVDRPGVLEPLTFRVTPEEDRLIGLLSIGVDPARSLTLVSPRRSDAREQTREQLEKLGLAGVQPGATLERVDGESVAIGPDFARAVDRARGPQVQLAFRQSDGSETVATLPVKPRLQPSLAPVTGDSLTPVEHLLGLMGVLNVQDATDAAKEQGLRSGDVFARLGGVEYPATHDGIREIRAHKGATIDAVVLRQDGAGAWSEVPLKLKVNRSGQVGFSAAESSHTLALVTRSSVPLRTAQGEELASPPPVLGVTPGSVIATINGQPVANLAEVRDRILSALGPLPAPDAVQTSDARPIVLRVGFRSPVGGVAQLAPEPSAAPIEETDWTIPHAHAAALRSLGYSAALSLGAFEPLRVTLKADNPLRALSMGIDQTRNVMLNTYLTFVRLAQGSVKVEHLKGPVGIAHLGTIIADRGFLWLLFFLAMISVNLAVINFLPLPIVDGGQFLFLVYEAIRGKPVPVGFQNAVTLAGLVLIGGMFLFVTYNDIRNLLGI